MQLNPAEISELIKSRIEGLGASADIRNQGTVVSVTDTTVPSLRMFALTPKPSMRLLISSEISAGFSCIAFSQTASRAFCCGDLFRR
jgi:hypothetical protein